jgi:hypothetical protein
VGHVVDLSDLLSDRLYVDRSGNVDAAMTDENTELLHFIKFFPSGASREV